MIIFSLFFMLWGINHATFLDVFDSSRVLINPTYGLANTLLLLTSSLLVAMGLVFVRHHQLIRAASFFRGGLLLGCGFVISKFFEYREKIQTDLLPSTNDFFLYYFVFTGIHLIHVLVGLLVLWIMTQRCQSDTASDSDLPFLEGGAIYWHMVDVLWIVLFLLIYLL